jgi:hypothetical protein
MACRRLSLSHENDGSLPLKSSAASYPSSNSRKNITRTEKSKIMPIDYSRYPSDWLKAIRPRIMARASNCCEECGLEHGATVFSIKLTVKDDAGRYKARCIWLAAFGTGNAKIPIGET